jgi:spore maturation protein CgeB
VGVVPPVRAIVAHPGPHFSVADVYDGWCGGLLDNGVKTMPYALDQRLDVFDASWTRRDGKWQRTFPTTDDAIFLASELLKAAAFDFWPDLVLVVSGFFVPPDVIDMLRARDMKVVLLATESPYQDDQQLEWAKSYDAVVLNDPTNLDKFRSVTDAWYIPHAHDPKKHKLGNRNVPRSDFAWCGTAFPSRVRLFEQVDWDGLNVRFAGNWDAVAADHPLLQYLEHPQGECCPNDETIRLYQGALTSCNLYRREANSTELAEGWAMGPREVELAACGTWFARDPRPESDEVLWMYPTFTDPDELGAQIRWAIDNPTQRSEATRLARAAVADRTFKNNASTLLGLLGL